MSEREVHQQFIKFLNSMRIPFLHSRTDKRTTTQLGDPDFCLTLGGRCLFIEIKVGTNKLSGDQEARISYLRKQGNPVEVCHSASECISAALTWSSFQSKTPCPACSYSDSMGDFPTYPPRLSEGEE